MNKEITIDFCVWLQRNFDALIASWAELSRMEGTNGLTAQHNQVALPNNQRATEAPVAVGSGERTAKDEAKEAWDRYRQFAYELAKNNERKSWWESVKWR